MAVDNTQKSYPNMEFPLGVKRQDAFSLDPTETHPSFEAAQDYARNDPTAYVGQEIAVVVNGVTVGRYVIKNTAGDLEIQGGGGSGTIDESSVATDEEVDEMLDDVFTADNTAEE